MMSPSNFNFEDFKSHISVSRETEDKLKCYAALLIKWNKAINLVGRETIPDLWQRHFLDSAQLLKYLPNYHEDRKRIIVDFGSGAGFPALILAILGAGEVHAMESDIKKSTFLREVSRETSAG